MRDSPKSINKCRAGFWAYFIFQCGGGAGVDPGVVSDPFCYLRVVMNGEFGLKQS